MGRIVYKFGPVHPDVPFSITLPYGSNIVHVGIQTNKEGTESIYMWVELDGDSEHVLTRKFHVFGTGWVMPDVDTKYPIHYDHRGSVVMKDGLVWHLYELI